MAGGLVPIVGAIPQLGELAGAVAAFGILCLLVHRRLPRGLGISLFVAAASVTAGLAAIGYGWATPGDAYWPVPVSTYTIARLAACLCLVWAVCGSLASRGAGGAVPTPPLATTSATFFAWSLVCGVAAGALTAYVLVVATSARLLASDGVLGGLPAGGFWNIAAVFGAVLAWLARVKRRQQPVLMLILAALLVSWTSLMIPSAVGAYGVRPAVLVPWQPRWWTWTFQMQFGLGLLLAGAAVLQEWRYRSRRARAWPNRLDDLLTPYSTWPAYTQTESMIAAAVLLLGVYHVVRPGPPSARLALASGVIAVAAGATCMYMAYRRWSANTAGLGIALVSLWAVAWACATTPLFAPVGQATEYAARLPVVYNAVLFGMAVVIALWSWLAGFWRQQLLDGAAWTTTGRMIPYARRAAYLLTALAVLAAYQMALWPRRALASVEDNTPGRLAAGVAALLLLALVTGRNARRSDSPAVATLFVALLMATGVFIFIRLPASELRGRLTQYDAVVLSAAALPVLLLAEALPKTRWRSLAVPLWWLGLLILPAGALVELLAKRLPAGWVQPLSLAILGAVYTIAGRREHRRAMLGLAGVLLLLAAISLYRAYGAGIMA